jgi:hypothetical protein
MLLLISRRKTLPRNAFFAKRAGFRSGNQMFRASGKCQFSVPASGAWEGEDDQSHRHNIGLRQQLPMVRVFPNRCDTEFESKNSSHDISL